MTIRDLIEQFQIEGGYCIKKWVDEWNDYARFAEGTDFFCGDSKIKKCLDFKIAYMYAIDGVLNIEVE